MKQDIFPAIRLTIVSLILVSVLYPLLIWGFAQFIGPAQGKVELVYHNGKASWRSFGGANL